MSPESFIDRMKSSLSSRKSLTSSQFMPTRKPEVPLSLLSWVRRINGASPKTGGSSWSLQKVFSSSLWG